MKINIASTVSILFAVALTSSCKKKLDFQYDNRINQQPLNGSSVRLVNMANATDLKINGKPLTSFIPPDRDGYFGPDQTRGTIYFPETGRLGASYTVPQQFVNANGWIDSIVFSSMGPKSTLPPSRPFRAKDDFNDPHDYYYVRFRPNTANYMDSLFAIPRSVSAPANPASFKLRLLNLSSEPDKYSEPGLFRKGSMSLAWADGTPVAGLENINPGAYSPYIEIPYGTYQFKVLDRNGREVQGNSSLILNPATGTFMDYYGTPGPGGRADTWLTYAPFKTFQPGGVYTVAVSMNYDCTITNGNPNGETITTEGNTFRIVNDIAEPVNMTYGRLQGVNAFEGKEIKWQVNGAPMGEALSFTKYTPYSIYVTEKYNLKAIDKTGAVLAEKDLSLQPGDNITAWLYPARNGAPSIALVANNLSTKYYKGNASEEGSYSTYRDGIPFWMRFMNFCSDLDEVTFTADNGLPFLVNSTSKALNASQHILPGIAVTEDPYVQLFINHPTQVLAYVSRPGVAPGDWLSNIAPLKSRDFIARPALYPSPFIPNREPGIYTVALVGNSRNNARMIILKHNK